MLPTSIDLFDKIRALTFPDGQYVIVGSGIMAAKGIREAHDLDIVVTPELFEKCRNEGWEVRPWTKPGMEGKEWLKKGNVDLHLEVSSGDVRSTAEDLLREAEIMNGIPFITLQQLIAFKRAYGRPKDFEDIKLIEEYLARR